MHNPESVLENETHNNNQISVRRPDLVIVNKKEENQPNSGFTVPVDFRVKLNENEKEISAWTLQEN